MSAETRTPAGRARVVLVGVRGFGEVHAERIRRLADQGLVELVAAVDPGVVLDPPTIYGADLYADLAEALSAAAPVDVVAIAAPLSEHFHLARTALTAGSDVYLEKPPVTTMDDFSQLLELEQQTGHVVQVGFQSLGSHALAMLQADAFGIGPVVRLGALGAWSRTVGYFTRSSWSGRRSMRGRAVVDGVVTNPLAHAVATALAVVGCRRLEDVDVVETDLYRANAIDSDDTSVVRIRTTEGLEVTCALSLCAPDQRNPEVRIEGTHGRATLSYTEDRIEVEANGQTRTESTGRTDLFENLLAYRRDGSALLVPLASTGAFMRVLAAVAEADEPIRINPRAVRWEGEGQDRRAIVEDVEHWLEKAVSTGRTFAELGATWAHPEQDRALVRAEVAGTEVAHYLDGHGTIATSSPRPYLHPVRSMAGVVLTARHPADHDWHFGVGMAIPDVNGTSFWGGGTYVHGQGYVLLDNHGEIVGEALEGQDERVHPAAELGRARRIGRAAGAAVDQLGGHRRANLEIGLRVGAARGRRCHAQLAGQQGPSGWRLRRVLLAVPGVRRRRGVHRERAGGARRSRQCRAVGGLVRRIRRRTGTERAGDDRRRRSGSGRGRRALVRPGQRLPRTRLGAGLGPARVAATRRRSLPPLRDRDRGRPPHRGAGRSGN